MMKHNPKPKPAARALPVMDSPPRSNGRVAVFVSEVVQAVCNEYGVTPRAIRGRSKIAAVSEPRRVALYLVRKITRIEYWYFCTAVASVTPDAASKHVKKIQNRLAGGDQLLAQRVAAIEKALEL